MELINFVRQSIEVLISMKLDGDEVERKSERASFGLTSEH